VNLNSIIDEFHKIYYGPTKGHYIFGSTKWLGVFTQKCPLDLWIYQELIFKTKPDYIIESGTMFGGSALYLASICELLGKGQVLTIDVNKKKFPQHKRIRYLTGSSIDERITSEVEDIVNYSLNKILVILDSDHTKNHVLEEMEIYSKFVSKDSYLIVEDTNINGHPVLPEFGDGPMEAVEEFLKKHSEFVIDSKCEKFLLTFNPKGYLKKIQ